MISSPRTPAWSLWGILTAHAALRVTCLLVNSIGKYSLDCSFSSRPSIARACWTGVIRSPLQSPSSTHPLLGASRTLGSPCWRPHFRSRAWRQGCPRGWVLASVYQHRVCHHPAGGYLLFLVSGQSAFCFLSLICRVETTLAGSGLLMLDLEDQDVPLGVVVLGKL